MTEGPLPPAPPPARRLADDARRLVPFARPQLRRILAVLALTVVVASAEGGQTMLLQPLLNRVLLRGGSEELEGADRDLVEEADLRLHQAGRADDRLRAVRARAASAVAALGTASAADVASALAGLAPLRGRTTPDAWREARDEAPDVAHVGSVCELVGRTLDVARDTDDAIADDAVGTPDALLLDARARLLVAARLQGEAQALLSGTGQGLWPPAAAPRDRDAALVRSLVAREVARDASFAGARVTLWRVLVLSLLLAFVLAAGRFGVAALQAEVVSRCYADMQRALVRHVLGLSLGQVQGARQGDLLSRLSADLARSVVGVLIPLVEILVLQPVRVLLLYALAIFVAPWLALGLFLAAAAVLIPILRWGRTIRRSARKRQSALGEVLEAMHQMLAGVRVVKVFRREAYEKERFARTTEVAYRAEVASVRARTMSRTFLHLVNDVLFPIVAVIGCVLVVQGVGGLDAGSFATFAALVIFMYRPLRTMAMEWNTLQDCRPSLARALDVLDEAPRDVEPAGLPPLEGGLREGLVLEDVGFSYPGGKQVLSGVNLVARAGTMTAIVGPTGAGKSTLLDLVARFVEPTRGRLLVDGRPLAGFTRASWRARLALVAQDTFIFNDTIRENIRYGRLEATDAEVEEAARKAGIHEEIVGTAERPGLEGGYDYVVGERGSRLSGGQVQRLTIARAILRDPQVLLLDEAMSALDAKTEALVNRALLSLREGRTLFVVAHRLSTIQNADTIVVLGAAEQGQPATVLEQGTHKELLAKGGRYAELVKHLREPGSG